MSKQLLGILIISSALVACQQTRLAETELEAVQKASDVYLAYEQGDCARVYMLTGEEALGGLSKGELRDSLTLARAFCFEQEGETESALAIYAQLVRGDSRTFGATDAGERRREISALASDTEYATWVEKTVADAGAMTAARTPLSRIPAQFPPAARAAGIEGYAVVVFGVSESGETETPLVVASEPPLLFDGASLRAVRQWQFEPQEDAMAKSRQVIRILFRNASGITIEDAERLSE
ncbi:MAG: energy transducer TonB [Myxococcota bacterium]